MWNIIITIAELKLGNKKMFRPTGSTLYNYILEKALFISLHLPYSLLILTQRIYRNKGKMLETIQNCTYAIYKKGHRF